jgi:hypothetical protein
VRQDTPPVPSFYAGRRCRNGCAQAAVAWLLAFANRSPYGPGADLALEVYRRYPPDTPLALFGTTPGRLERICRASGFRTARFCGPGAPERLRAELAAGRPVVVLLNLGRLGSGWGLHYAVACGCDESAVYCANMLPAGGDPVPRLAVPWPEFLRAWRGWLPGRRFRYAALAAW